MGNKRSKKRSKALPETEEIASGPPTPKSFVLQLGTVGNAVSSLVRDVRKVMEPNTAARLKEQRKNKLKDFVSVASQFQITHMLLFTRTELATYLRLARVPRGPTITFKVNKYSLAKDVIKTVRRPKVLAQDYMTAPLLVLNNFNDSIPNSQLVTAMLQNMFPTIDVGTINLNECRRVLLLNYNEAKQVFDFRHYTITKTQRNVSAAVKSILRAKIPNLSKMEDISEFISGQSTSADSDVEDNDAVTNPDTNNEGSEGKSIKLLELGPRMELELVKIQIGICSGEILYHKFVKKTKAEQQEQTQKYEAKKVLVEKRRLEQQQNVERKLKAKQDHKAACGKPEPKAEDESDNEEIDQEANNEDNGQDLDLDEANLSEALAEESDSSEQDIFNEDEDLGNNSDSQIESDQSIKEEDEEELHLAPRKRGKK